MGASSKAHEHDETDPCAIMEHFLKSLCGDDYDAVFNAVTKGIHDYAEYGAALARMGEKLAERGDLFVRSYTK